MIKIVKKCRSVALRHLPRTHRIDVTWLFEVCGAPEVQMRHVGTDSQIADLMTKAFTSVEKWNGLLAIAQILSGPVKPERKIVVAIARPEPCLWSCATCGFRMITPASACLCVWN